MATSLRTRAMGRGCQMSRVSRTCVVLLCVMMMCTVPDGVHAKKGVMTYYTGSASASASGRRLIPFKSVAVADSRYLGRRANIRGVGIVRADDMCSGGGSCKTFDLYIGNTLKYQSRVPHWKLGNIPIEYEWI
jgi:hypothetical protein